MSRRGRSIRRCCRPRRAIADRVRGLAGTLLWEGAGTGAEASGSGRLAARFTIASWPGEEVAVEAAASLDRGRVSVTSFRGATRSLEVAGAGSWSAEEGFSGHVDGTVGDLARLLPPGKIALGGSGRFEGDFAADARGPRFSGAVQLAKATVGAFRGIEGSARLAADAAGVRLPEGAVVWPGGRGSAAERSRSHPGGSISRRISSSSRSRMPHACSASTRGSSRGRSPRGCGCAGRPAAPEIEGEVSGKGFATAPLAWTGRRSR